MPKACVKVVLRRKRLEITTSWVLVLVPFLTLDPGNRVEIKMLLACSLTKMAAPGFTAFTLR